jgi:hypothetical protein
VEEIDLDNNGTPDYQEEEQIYNQMPEPKVTYDSEKDDVSLLPSITLDKSKDKPMPPKKSFKERFGEGVDYVKEVVKDRQRVVRDEREYMESLSDHQLTQLAVRDTSGGFLGLGMNKYEKELIRREETKIFLHKKITDAHNNAIKTAKGESSSSGFGDSLGFLNPLSNNKSTPEKKTKNKSEKSNSIFTNDNFGFINPISTLNKRKK